MVVDVQDHQGKDAGVIEQGDCGQFSGCSDRDDAPGNRGGQLIDDQVYHQHRVEVEVVERGVADNTVDQPVVRSKRAGSLTASMTRTLFKLGGSH